MFLRDDAFVAHLEKSIVHAALLKRCLQAFPDEQSEIGAFLEVDCSRESEQYWRGKKSR